MADVVETKKRSRTTSEQTVLAGSVVIGGGIAGVCCAQQLALLYSSRQPSIFNFQYNELDNSRKDEVLDVLLVSATPTLVEVRLMNYTLNTVF